MATIATIRIAREHEKVRREGKCPPSHILDAIAEKAMNPQGWGKAVCDECHTALTKAGSCVLCNPCDAEGDVRLNPYDGGDFGRSDPERGDGMLEVPRYVKASGRPFGPPRKRG